MVNRFNFRVWDKENERMVYPNGNGYFNLKNDTVIDGNGKLFDLVCQETVDNCILMQSTGLVDKNGKEVFENCIINNNFLVVFKNYSFILINILNNDIVDFYEYTEKNRIEITDEYKQI